MVSTDAHIRQEARLFEDEINSAMGRRLDRLRLLLDDEINNMLQRCEAANATTTRLNLQERAAPWLHGKSFDQTYRDWAERLKRARTRVRIEALLRLCGGDRELLLTEYTRSLNIMFPISGNAFRWDPQLIQSDSGRVTLVHKWARIKNVTNEKEN